MKILLAEDNLFYRRMLESLLKEWGYTVVAVTNGEAAVEALRQPDAPRLAILNWMMPRLDGLEVCRRVRELKLTNEPYLIILSARSEREQVQTALASGANDYVIKPFDQQEMRMRLQVGHGVVGLKDSQSTHQGIHRVEATPRPAAVATADADKSAPVPPAVAGYEILEELGRGGMSVVYKARHIHMDRLVALKVINQELVKDADSLRRFYQETRAAGQMFHPNIVMAFDAGQIGSTHYLAMEYVVGIDLGRLLRQSGPLPVDQACDFMRQAALGLQHAHEKGLVHRDIKPSNLLATSSAAGAVPTRTSVVKILDMGLALLYRQPFGPTGAAAELTGEGKWMGTIDYMAPEQWKNAHRVDIRADLYSLGCTFYHLLTGQVPFPEQGFGDKMLKHYLEEPPPVEQSRPDVSPALAGLIRQLMAKQPENRFQTPIELVSALQELPSA